MKLAVPWGEHLAIYFIMEGAEAEGALGTELFVLERCRARASSSWAGLSHAELTAIASVQSLNWALQTKKGWTFILVRSLQSCCFIC